MDKYLVVGNPISHSLSPEIHRLFSHQLNEEISYSKKLISQNSFEKDIINLLKKEKYNGINVTLPFKSRAFKMSGVRSNEAFYAEAANVLTLKNKQIFSYNTDGKGLLIDLKENNKVTIKDKRILVIGAGGASKGILSCLIDEKPKAILVANRTYEKALGLVDRLKELKFFTTQLYALTLNQINQYSYDLIINATSINFSNGMIFLDKSIFNNGCFVYDMMYGKEKTLFLKEIEKFNIINSCDGLGMLIEQAAESYFIWRGKRPKTKEIIKLLKKKYNNKS